MRVLVFCEVGFAIVSLCSVAQWAMFNKKNIGRPAAFEEKDQLLHSEYKTIVGTRAWLHVKLSVGEESL